MKKHTFILIVIFGLFFSGCKKDEDQHVDELKMQIDNEDEILFEVTTEILGSKVKIDGNNSSKTLQLQVPVDAIEGDYQSFVIFYAENNNPVFSAFNINGKNLHVSKNDMENRIVTGTFSVNYIDDLQNPHTATGSFEVAY